MFKEQKETMSKDLQRTRTMSQQIENIIKEKLFYMNQIEILELETIITEMKNPLKR